MLDVRIYLQKPINSQKLRASTEPMQRPLALGVLGSDGSPDIAKGCGDGEAGECGLRGVTKRRVAVNCITPFEVNPGCLINPLTISR